MMSETKGIERQPREGEKEPAKRIVILGTRQERRIGGAKDVILKIAEDFNQSLVDFAEYMA